MIRNRQPYERNIRPICINRLFRDDGIPSAADHYRRKFGELDSIQKSTTTAADTDSLMLIKFLNFSPPLIGDSVRPTGGPIQTINDAR